SSAVRPLYWALRQRRASTELLVSTVCTMTSFGQAAHSISQALTRTLAFIRPASASAVPSDDPCEVHSQKSAPSQALGAGLTGMSGKSWSHQRRRVDASKVRLRFGLLKGRRHHLPFLVARI